ncbi:hypothetical protein P5V15_007801 [Pogonomyrmex californicus]
MTSSNEKIVGRCPWMCPKKEQIWRQREGLLHRFEIYKKTINMRKPIGDPMKMVKCFKRSAAGNRMTDPDSLRPPHVLLSTIRYLFTKIAKRTDFDWAKIYDFIFDRLRAIRQDAVIQRIDTAPNILLLEQIVRFHIYSAQRLCEKNISEFDPKINSKHLLECINQLLILYDQQDYENIQDNSEIHKDLEKLTLINRRSEMEAIYILLHIGDNEALRRALILPSDLKKTSAVELATKISLAWYTRNYVRVSRLVRQLNKILACAFFCNLQSFRRDVLQIMSFGYDSKVLTYPGLKLQELLFYKDINKIQADCNSFNLTFTDENVLFQKSQFNNQVLLVSTKKFKS